MAGRKEGWKRGRRVKGEGCMDGGSEGGEARVIRREYSSA